MVWCKAVNCIHWKKDKDGDGICCREMTFIDEEGNCEDVTWDETEEEEEE